MTFCPQPKPRPSALERADRRKARESTDDAESRKVKARSGGRCEVTVIGAHGITYSCFRRAVHVHHMIGGWGVRARGESALAEHKQAVCNEHHGEITHHILVRIGGVAPLWTDYYVRAK